MNINNRKVWLLFSITALLILTSSCSFINENKSTSNFTTHNTTSINNDEEEKEVFGLVQKAINIEYEAEKDKLKEVFTENYINNLDKTFYKTDLKPYEIIEDSFKVTEKKDNIYTAIIRINDKNGQYVQVITIIYKNNKYLIDNIEYDI